MVRTPGSDGTAGDTGGKDGKKNGVSGETESQLLLRPRMRQSAGETADCSVDGCLTVGDRLNDARRHESQWRKKPRMPFDDPLTYGDLLKRSCTSFNEVVHPTPRLCDRFQESVPSCGIETLRGRFMDDALPSGCHRSYPPNANHALYCRMLAVGAAAAALLI